MTLNTNAEIDHQNSLWHGHDFFLHDDCMPLKPVPARLPVVMADTTFRRPITLHTAMASSPYRLGEMYSLPFIWGRQYDIAGSMCLTFFATSCGLSPASARPKVTSAIAASQ